VGQAEQLVGLAGAEDLPVAGVVGEEGDLAGDDRQPGGDQQLYQESPSRTTRVQPAASRMAFKKIFTA
jgi:hypothetical protein